jgi:ubiquinone/menaquinone biosynthesis C-methylase UbiE
MVFIMDSRRESDRSAGTKAAQVTDAYTKLSASYEETRLSPYMQLIEGLEQSIIAEQVDHIGACRVLEIGCGTGRFSGFLAQLGCQVHALDITPAMLEQAQKLRGHICNVAWTNASAEMLPFMNASFDLVVALKVLPHVVDLASALTDIARVLHHKGRAILEFYNPLSLGSLTRRYGFFTRWLSPSQVKNWIERSGQRILSCRGARVVIPFGSIMEVPVVHHFLARVECQLSHSRLCRLASYYIVIVEPQ